MAQAFRHVTGHFELAPPQALMVGDSPELDHDAALSAELAALLLDRAGRHAGSARACVGSLHAVPCG